MHLKVIKFYQCYGCTTRFKSHKKPISGDFFLGTQKCSLYLNSPHSAGVFPYSSSRKCATVNALYPHFNIHVQSKRTCLVFWAAWGDHQAKFLLSENHDSILSCLKTSFLTFYFVARWDVVTHCFKFLCFSSCRGSINRRPILLIFTLESHE